MLHNRYIYIVCGGSGGHIMPGLGVCNILAKISGIDIFLVGVKRKENIEIFNSYASDTPFKNVKYLFLQDLRLKKFTALNVTAYVVKLLLTIFKVLIMFIDNRPSAVIGFGSYAAFPVVFVATFFKSTLTVIHEQNLRFGRANKLLIPLTDKIAISFTQSKEYLSKIDRDLKFKIYNRVCKFIWNKPRIEKKVLVTGNPSIIKEENDYTREDTSLKRKKNINILVIGGSQGSSFLNCIVPEALSSMKKPLLERVEVLHITGIHDIKEVEDRYKKANMAYSLKRISFNMPSLYKESDLVISRAGATALSEIIFYKIPAILLPFKYGQAHQRDNASLFKRLEAALVLEENECSKDKLKDNIQMLLEDTSLRNKLISNLENLGNFNTRNKIINMFQENLS